MELESLSTFHQPLMPNFLEFNCCLEKGRLDINENNFIIRCRIKNKNLVHTILTYHETAQLTLENPPVCLLSTPITRANIQIPLIFVCDVVIIGDCSNHNGRIYTIA